MMMALERQGKYEEAEAMHRQALEGYEKVLGSEHLHTLTSVYCLAHLLANRYLYGESLDLYDRACAAYSVIFGENHPITQSPLHVTNIALRLSLCKIGLGLCLLLQKRTMAQVYTAARSRLSRGLAKLGIRSSRHGRG